jgi:hypothetical protein
MSSSLEVGENLEETEFVDAVNGYDSSVNNDSVINGEILEEEEEDEPFKNEPEPEPEQQVEEGLGSGPEQGPEQGPEETGEESEQESKNDQHENVTFTITDGSFNYVREHISNNLNTHYPFHKDISTNNVDRSIGIVQTPIPRRANPRFFNAPIQRPGQHLKTMFF